MSKFMVAMLAILVLAGAPAAQAVLYGGIEFPAGAASFADEIVSYAPGSDVSGGYLHSSQASGLPDGAAVSLGGVGGELIVRFTDNSLTTSGTTDEDLWIFEVGSAIEPTSIAVSLNGTDWIGVGDVGGATSGVDLDAFIGSGITLGSSYSYVRIIEIDPPGSPDSGSPYAGADIDAVGAIASAPPVIGLPDAGMSVHLLGLALAGLATIRRRV